jgi:hypothetical protein
MKRVGLLKKQDAKMKNIIISLHNIHMCIWEGTMKRIMKLLLSRYRYIKDLREYEKQKRSEALWVAQQEEIDSILGTNYAKDLR